MKYTKPYAAPRIILIRIGHADMLCASDNLPVYPGGKEEITDPDQELSGSHQGGWDDGE